MRTLVNMWQDKRHTNCVNIPCAWLPFISTDLRGQRKLQILVWDFPIPFYKR